MAETAARGTGFRSTLDTSSHCPNTLRGTQGSLAASSGKENIHWGKVIQTNPNGTSHYKIPRRKAPRFMVPAFPSRNCWHQAEEGCLALAHIYTDWGSFKPGCVHRRVHWGTNPHHGRHDTICDETLRNPHLLHTLFSCVLMLHPHSQPQVSPSVSFLSLSREPICYRARQLMIMWWLWFYHTAL